MELRLDDGPLAGSVIKDPSNKYMHRVIIKVRDHLYFISKRVRYVEGPLKGTVCAIHFEYVKEAEIVNQ